MAEERRVTMSNTLTSGFILCFMVLLFSTPTVLSDVDEKLGENWCVVTKSQRAIDIVTVPCVEKIKASCGWFSISYCTMYRKTYCKKELNTTRVLYYKMKQCCEGFVKTPNNACINETTLDPHLRSIIDNTTDKGLDEYFIVDPEDSIPHKDSVLQQESVIIHKTGSGGSSINLSQGAYAGIACAIMFLIVTAVFVFIAVRKKRLRTRQNMKSRHMADGELGERVTFHTTPIVKTTKSNKSVESEEIERLHLATEDT